MSQPGFERIPLRRVYPAAPRDPDQALFANLVRNALGVPVRESDALVLDKIRLNRRVAEERALTIAIALAAGIVLGLMF